MTATFTGVHAHDHRLPDWTRAGREAAHDELLAVLEALQQAHPMPMRRWSAEDVTGTHAMPETDAYARIPYWKGPDWKRLAADAPALDAALAGSLVGVRHTELESRHFHDRDPALWTGEAVFGAVALMARPFQTRAARLGPLAMRLDAIPGFLAAMPRTITGRVPPRWIDRARRECGAAAQLFTAGLDAWLAEEPPEAEAASRVRAAGRRAAAAFAQCGADLAHLRVATEHEYGVGGLALDALVAGGHQCTEPIDLLLERALEALPPAQARLDELVRAVAPSMEAFRAALADDRVDADAFLPAFHERWEACRAHAAAHDLVHWPEWPLRYVPIPPWARDAAPQLYWLFYRSPAPFDPYSVHDYLVTPVDDTVPADERERRLRAWNRSTITLNHVVHHGALGHHVQNWHATHRSASRIGTIAGVDGASRIAGFLGGTMTEGWACYATDLMDELGFLTPLERAAEQQSRVRMLARAIVDLRLHTHEYSLPEAAAFYREAAGLAPEAAEAEVTKNSMFPATALMYWLGTQGIHDLRADLQRRDGAAFSLRGFHDALLGWGSIPVPLVSKLLLEGAPA